jgi:hypothetical protein
MVAAVMAAGAVTTALRRPGSTAAMAINVDEDETTTATAVASVPVASVPETQTQLAACPSPNARTNPRGSAIGKRGSVENDGGGDDDDSKPSLVTTSSRALLVASYPDQAVVQEETKTHYELPLGWKCIKLEPDC